MFREWDRVHFSSALCIRVFLFRCRMLLLLIPNFSLCFFVYSIQTYWNVNVYMRLCASFSKRNTCKCILRFFILWINPYIKYSILCVCFSMCYASIAFAAEMHIRNSMGFICEFCYFLFNFVAVAVVVVWWIVVNCDDENTEFWFIAWKSTFISIMYIKCGNDSLHNPIWL